MHYSDRTPKATIPAGVDLYNKWPCMQVSGTRVTPQQAFEIIRRTDHFLTECNNYSGGNNQKYNRKIQLMCGFGMLLDMEQEARKLSGKAEGQWWNWDESFHLGYLIRLALGRIETEYVYNRWASSAFVYGPTGWCHPDGTIQFGHNVGKWPSIEALVIEWECIAEAFPFLDLAVSFWNVESGVINGEYEEDEGPTPAITAQFRVRNGAVEFAPLDKSIQHDIVADSAAVGGVRKFRDLNDPMSEHGLDENFLTAVGELQRPVIEKILTIAKELGVLEDRCNEQYTEWYSTLQDQLEAVDWAKLQGVGVIDPDFITKDGLILK